MTTGSMGDRSNPTLASTTSQSGSGHTGYRAGTNDDVNKAKNAVGDAARMAKAEASDLAHDLKAHGEQLVQDAKSHAQGLAEQQKTAGADQVEGIARAVGKAADELESASPQLAQYVRNAATAAEGFSSSLRNRNFGEILEDVTAYARREPVMFFGITVAAGFAISRFLKSSAERAASERYGYGAGPGRSYGGGAGTVGSSSYGQSGSYGQPGTRAYGQPGTRPATPVSQTSSTPMEYPTGRTSSTDPMHSSTTGTSTGSTSAGHLGTPVSGSSSTTGGTSSSPSKVGGPYR